MSEYNIKLDLHEAHILMTYLARELDYMGCAEGNCTCHEQGQLSHIWNKLDKLCDRINKNMDIDNES
jgi:hypothetical protein